MYKGNVPSRFGGRVSSVLDVTLENPSLDSFRAQVGIGMVSSRLLLDVPIVKDKLGFIATGRSAFTDFLLPIISKKNLPFTLQSTINQTFSSNIAGNRDFMWNVMLAYNFGNTIRSIK